MNKKKNIKALLVFNKTPCREFRIVTNIQDPILAKEVQCLLKEQKNKQAFSLISSRAQVDRYLPSGTRLSKRPDIILIEDTL